MAKDDEVLKEEDDATAVLVAALLALLVSASAGLVEVDTMPRRKGADVLVALVTAVVENGALRAYCTPS